MDRREFLSVFGSASLLPLSTIENKFSKTREPHRCVVDHDDYITGIRFYRRDPPYLRSCDPEEATRCIYTSTHQDHIGEVGQELEPPTDFRFKEYDIYMNLIQKKDWLLVKQRGLGSASQGKQYLGWE
ncbi:hypothetical protein PNP83_05790 [Halobacterium salinarum]|nr:hypothetical protein [Halobacterium salinarum]